VGCKPTHLSASRPTHDNHGGQIRLHRYHTAIWREIQAPAVRQTRLRRQGSAPETFSLGVLSQVAAAILSRFIPCPDATGAAVRYISADLRQIGENLALGFGTHPAAVRLSCCSA
jgi:hypothetical protein